MANIDQLNTIKTNLLGLVVSITANPQPTYSLDGKNVSWSEYLDNLNKQIEQVNKLMRAEVPYESRSQAM